VEPSREIGFEVAISGLKVSVVLVQTYSERPFVTSARAHKGVRYSMVAGASLGSSDETSCRFVDETRYKLTLVVPSVSLD
jgi:hypothetical protein